MMNVFNLGFGEVNEGAQGVVDGLIVAKGSGDVWLQQDKVCAGAVASGVFSPDAAFHLCEIVFGTKIVRQFFVNLFLHSIAARMV